MDRRQFLAGSGVAAGSLLAGCSGGSGGSESGATSSGSAGSYTTQNGVQITVSDVHLQRRLAQTESQIERPEAGEAFVLAQLTATNTGGSPQSFPRYSAFDFVADGTQYGPLRTERSFIEEVVMEPGLYTRVEDAQSEVSTTGWIAFAVPEETTSGEIAWSSREESTTWPVSLQPDAMPSFDVSVSAEPAELALGESGTLVVSLSNTGERTGAYSREWELARPYADDESGRLNVEVPGGETRTWEREVTPRVLGDTTLSLPALEESATLTSTPAHAAWGETWTSPRGVACTIERPQLTKTLTSGDTTTSADEGLVYGLVRISVENTASASRDAPDSNAVSLASGEQSFEQAAPFWFSTTLDEPVQGSIGSMPSALRALDPGEEGERWIVFRVAEGTPIEDLHARVSWTVGMLSDDRATVIWGDT